MLRGNFYRFRDGCVAQLVSQGPDTSKGAVSSDPVFVDIDILHTGFNLVDTFVSHQRRVCAAIGARRRRGCGGL